MPDLPVIVLAFANDQEGHRYLRDLPEELRRLQDILEAAETQGPVQAGRPAQRHARADLRGLHRASRPGGDPPLRRPCRRGPAPARVGRRGGAVAHAEGLAAFLGQRRNLQLVFLNGCSTRAQIAGLLEAGVTAVIATARAIEDQVAREFAVAFYTELAAGATIPAAFEAARGRVRAAREPHRRRASNLNRDLVAEDATAGAPADDRGFPWELRLRAGAELAARWSLPDAAGNPLFGLPPLPEQDLPESPFRHLTWFTARDAEVFFGRGHTISELFKQVKEPGRPPILLLHGSSGVGKSSVLDAGLVPRLQGDGLEVRYRRRDPEKGLLRSLLAAFAAAGAAPPSTLADAWRSRGEAAQQAPDRDPRPGGGDVHQPARTRPGSWTTSSPPWPRRWPCARPGRGAS